MADGRHFLYVADPMCSWCYGFGPVVSGLVRRFEGRLGLRLLMGGLRPGETRPMRDKDRAYLEETWTRVGEASGQPFDTAILARESFVYDTEPACRAVVTARTLAPETGLAMLAAVSRAFYAEGRDVTDADVLAGVAAGQGFEPALFRDRLLSPEARQATAADFISAKQAGIEGFPLLAAGSAATGYALVCQGFRPLDGLPEAIEDWLAAGAPVVRREA